MDKWEQLCRVCGVEAESFCKKMQSEHCGKCKAPILTDCDKVIWPDCTPEKLLALEEMLIKTKIQGFWFGKNTLRENSFVYEVTFDINKNMSAKHRVGYGDTRPEALADLIIQLISADVVDMEEVKQVMKGGEEE